jgi:hypothetical protein
LLQGRTSYHHRVITAGRSVEPLRSYGSGAAPRDQVGRFCGGSRHSSEVKVFHTGKRFFITFAYLRSRWERHAYCKSIRRAADRLAIMPRLEAGPGTKKKPHRSGAQALTGNRHAGPIRGSPLPSKQRLFKLGRRLPGDGDHKRLRALETQLRALFSIQSSASWRVSNQLMY